MFGELLVSHPRKTFTLSVSRNCYRSSLNYIIRRINERSRSLAQGDINMRDTSKREREREIFESKISEESNNFYSKTEATLIRQGRERPGNWMLHNFGM